MSIRYFAFCSMPKSLNPDFDSLAAVMKEYGFSFQTSGYSYRVEEFGIEEVESDFIAHDLCALLAADRNLSQLVIQNWEGDDPSSISLGFIPFESRLIACTRLSSNELCKLTDHLNARGRGLRDLFLAILNSLNGEFLIFSSEFGMSFDAFSHVIESPSRSIDAEEISLILDRGGRLNVIGAEKFKFSKSGDVWIYSSWPIED